MEFVIEQIRRVLRDDGSEVSFTPVRATEGSSGYDVFAAVDIVIPSKEWRLVPLGFKVELLRGWEMQVRGRSGLALKHGLGVVNGIGTIDSDYRGEVGALVMNGGPAAYHVKAGDKIAQVVIVELPETSLKPGLVNMNTKRGTGGFGSTG